MMPDKIHLEDGHAEPVVGFVGPAWNNPKDLENPIEYIRKEALLEWAKDKLPVELTIYGFIGGYIAAYKEIIDKLNSM